MTTEAAVPHRVRWGPSDAHPAGIRTWPEEGSGEQFIPWSELEEKLRRQLLPQLSSVRLS